MVLVDTEVGLNARQFLAVIVTGHSAKADQNPFVLRTPGILENVPERRAKPNCL